MIKKDFAKPALSGTAAGAVNGLFSAGGGMVLVPLLTKFCKLEEHLVFPASVSVMLPICAVSLVTGDGETALPFQEAWPFLLGSIPGGILAALFSQKIQVKWLHRILGIMILWGGIRYLC